MLVTILCCANLFYYFISEFTNVKNKSPVEETDIIEKQKVQKNDQVVKLRPRNTYMIPKKMPIHNTAINDMNENEIEKEVIRIASYRTKWNIEEFYNLLKRQGTML